MRMILIAIAAILGLAVGGLWNPGMAGTERPYEAGAFASAQEAGKPILIDVTASWCPTCARQRPIIAKLLQADEFAELVVFTIDYDADYNTAVAFKAYLQSTLIVFKGKNERGRSTGDTRQDSIRSLMQAAMKP